MVTCRELLDDKIHLFTERGIENAAFELSELLGMVLGVDCRSAEYVQALGEEASDDVRQRLSELTARRISGEPLQYILGEWEFYGLPIKVGRGVLIPRQDTETLIDVIQGKLIGRNNLTAIDVCSGSGCIACAISNRLDCQKVYCVEKSDDAVPYLRENLSRHCADYEIIQADALLEETVNRLPDADLIVCNPPYLSMNDMEQLQTEVSFEPEMALYGGEDGLDFCRDFIRLWAHKLRPTGMMIVEIGIGQEEEVAMMMVQHGLVDIRWRKDMCGINRCVYGFARF